LLIVPDCLHIRRSQGAEESLLSHIRTWLESDKRDPRIHVSDLLDTRLGYWQRKKPLTLPDKLVTMFLIGKVLHAFVEEAVDVGQGKARTGKLTSDEGSVYDKDLDLVYSVDKMIKGYPAELKTSRTFYEPRKHKDIADYCEQLLCYMVAKKKTKGFLWVLLLNCKDPRTGRTAPAVRCFVVTVTEQGLRQYEKQMLDARTAVQHALRTDDYRSLPVCRSYKCSEQDCQWWEECKPEGRYPRKRPSKGWPETQDDLRVKQGRRNATTRTGLRTSRTQRAHARRTSSSRRPRKRTQ